MAREFSRNQRVEGQIARKLAEIIQKQVNDPRVGMVSITQVEVSRDLSYAKVHFTAVSAQAEVEKKAVEKVLNGAKGFLRKLLTEVCDFRTSPNLKFFYDHSEDRSERLSSLIDGALQAVVD